MIEVNARSQAQICSICVMDSDVPGIQFTESTGCNYCNTFRRALDRGVPADSAVMESRRDQLVGMVKRQGIGKAYDCVVGVSGGVDSSWALVKAVDLGLRPLAVHMDNGWNSELAQHNIACIVQPLGVDLYSHVIDWEEYKGLMQAFFDAGVVDVELLYDNAMLAVNFAQARKIGTKFILSGTNTATEGMLMPPGWNWYKFDKRNIKAISRAFGGPALETFPSMGTLRRVRDQFMRRIQWVPFLDYMNYSKSQAVQELSDRFGFRPYPYKHYESVFTRFYQGYLLPEKFGIDKRKLHLSNLIVSGQIGRIEALELLNQSPYPSSQDLESDVKYFLKKMGWSKTELDLYLAAEIRPHSHFNSEFAIYRALRYFWRMAHSSNRLN